VEETLKKPWFSEGLRFKCTGCGGCCTGSPGYVYLSLSDLERLANHLQMSSVEFAKQYTRQVDDMYALLERPVTYDCVFLEGKTCSVYEARPVQCRTFPWWIHNIREMSDWKEAAKSCEGIDLADAPLVDAEIIQEQCMSYLDNLLEQNFSL
jgi:Fe-S-cluster containining protein